MDELEARLNKNSRNSSKPPSSDGPGARGPGQNVKKEGRKRGGQPGHSGSKRVLLPVEKVDRVVDVYPEACESCHHRLPQQPDPNALRHQVTELPEIKAHTTEYRSHRVTCGCGHRTLASTEKVPVSAFGPRLSALVALLTGVYNLSRRETEKLLFDVLAIDVSLGAVSAIEGRTTKAIKDVWNEILSKVTSEAVNYTDSTTWLLMGKHQSLWTLASTAGTYFEVLPDGRSETVQALLGRVLGHLVSDRATVFLPFPMGRRQICWAHLLRKFVEFSERQGPSGKLGKELVDGTLLMFEYWHQFQDGRLGRNAFQRQMLPLQKQIEACLRKAAQSAIKEMSGSCEDILGHQEALWTFVTVAGVPPTNNHAERELRRFVMWRKRCFGAQSKRGNAFAASIMSVARTARKQGRNLFRFLMHCLTAFFEKRPAPSIFLPVMQDNTS